ncbi:hypothetical protein KAR91_77430, partial [Candidatus Pacearchaeota archaeon]|nr:hypothetical protein [Candidatus Pacearchaeota archaeon]
CADGDAIDGFMNSLEPATLDGKQYGTVQTGGRMRVQASAASTLGAYVEAGAVAAPGTAEANGLGLVSTHDMDSTSAATLLADMFQKQWRIISATRVDGTVDDADTSVIIEKL